MSLRAVGRSLFGLFLCLSGAVIADWLSMPIPWMLGPLLAMSTCRIWGAGADAPFGGRQAGQVIIGCSLGLYFTPDVVRVLTTYAGTMLFTALMAVVFGIVHALVLTRLTRIDRTTAFYASMPGGAAAMAVLAERHGAVMEKVVISQTLRVVIVILTIPAVLIYAGAHGADHYQPASTEVHYLGLALLLLLCATTATIASRLRLPNACLIGPLATSIALTLLEMNLSAMPNWLSNTGQLLLGCALGAHFQPGFLRRTPRFLLGAIAGTSIVIFLSAALAALLARDSDLALPTMVLAVAPGGVGEMGVTAKVLGLGVPLVTAFHVTRIVVLVTLMPLVYGATRAAFRRMQGAADKSSKV